MTDTDAAAPGADLTNGADNGPAIRILAQFVRDLSFENPRAPDLCAGVAQPQIDMGVEMNARGREDGFFEVDLKLSARAARDDGPVFHVARLWRRLRHQRRPGRPDRARAAYRMPAPCSRLRAG